GAGRTAWLRALGAATSGAETILLVTDGEDHEQRGLRAAEACRDRGVPVHCVGFGSRAGAKVTVDEDGREAFLRDRGGHEVVTALDPTSLGRIADTTGGEFVDASSRARPIADLYERRIAPMARKAFAEDRRRE